MRHKLSIETLEVQSFHTAPDTDEQGTAREFCPTFCFTQCHTECTCPATP
ncbi:MAG: hypothetical protein KY467_02790 [Gemmatimonadetes bacterium]|nr:hypothetical protein [Gemmatimonadota bacterium]